MKILKIAISAFAALLLPGCVQLTIAWADLKPRGASASPAIFTPLSVAEWRQAQAPMIRNALEQHVVGVMPGASQSRVIDKRVIDQSAFGGRGRLEEWRIIASAEFNGESVETRPVFGDEGFLVHVVLPTKTDIPAPVIMMQTFCPWWDAMPHEGVSKPEDAKSMGDGILGGVGTYVFGRFICTPPYEEILDQGYAVASFAPSSVVPDRDEDGLAELARLASGHDDDKTRWGAVGAWGWLFSRLVDALESDERFDDSGMIVWGHSRYGKAALYAAAFDQRIDGVIAHQSGTGGASLNRNKPGESVKSMTKNYPHWFARSYGDAAGKKEAMPVDQHHLLALIAPRPILLGNARRDVWSDPNGAFRAAMGADKVWELFGSKGLDQERLNEWKPAADIAFWIRPGTHGVVEEDWPAFLEFLNAHFPPSGDTPEASVKVTSVGDRG